MSKHLITIAATPHGVLSAKHDGLDQQYCESGETVFIDWQPDDKWGLQECHYTDENNNVVDIDLTTRSFVMPAAAIEIGGTFKRFVVGDWTDGLLSSDAEVFVKGANGQPLAVDLPTLGAAMIADGVFFPTPVNEGTGGEIFANIFCKKGVLTAATTFTFEDVSEHGISHYYWSFETGATAPTITWPAEITAWVGGSAPVIAANTHYEISVIDGIAAYLEAAI